MCVRPTGEVIRLATWTARRMIILALVTMLVTAVAFAVADDVMAQRRVPIRWATADVGSYGYSVASMMVDVLNRELPSQYVVTVHPYPSTTAAMRAAMNGEAEISYTADVGMRELYDRVGPYEDFTPRMSDLVHTWYAYPMESFLTAPRGIADQFNAWGDF